MHISPKWLASRQVAPGTPLEVQSDLGASAELYSHSVMVGHDGSLKRVRPYNLLERCISPMPWLAFYHTHPSVVSYVFCNVLLPVLIRPTGT